MRVDESRPLLAGDAAAINMGDGDGRPSETAKKVGGRLTSIDLLRGAIVIIMVRTLLEKERGRERVRRRGKEDGGRGGEQEGLISWLWVQQGTRVGSGCKRSRANAWAAVALADGEQKRESDATRD